MYRTFESIKNCQRCDLLKIFVIPGGNATPHKFQRGGTSAPLPNRSGRYQGTTPTTWLNFNTPCKSQPTILPYYYVVRGSSRHDESPRLGASLGRLTHALTSPVKNASTCPDPGCSHLQAAAHCTIVVADIPLL